MHPILFKVGSFEFYNYGLLMAIGVLVGLLVMDLEAKRYHWNREIIVRLVVFTFIAGLFGSRVVYVITRMNEPQADLWALFFNFRAGFVFYGGLIASWIFGIWYARKHKLPLLSVLDAGCMAICIGLAMGRFGCLLGGCCYGTPTTLPWGVIMQNHSYLGPLHPAQLYEAFFLIAFFFVLWARRKKKAYEGESTVWFVAGYAVARYVLEFGRGDHIRGYVIEDVLSTSQFISIPLLAFAIALHFKLRRKKVIASA